MQMARALGQIGLGTDALPSAGAAHPAEPSEGTSGLTSPCTIPRSRRAPSSSEWAEIWAAPTGERTTVALLVAAVTGDISGTNVLVGALCDTMAAESACSEYSSLNADEAMDDTDRPRPRQ